MVTRSKLQTIAERAREELYRDHETTRTEDPDRIEGFCHENAFKVAEYLDQYGIDCIFVWGSIKNMTRSAEIDEAEVAGSVHHWVEVTKSSLSSCDNELDISGETFVIDPYALGSHKGELYISDQLPSDYQRLRGGFIQYESWMTPRDFISVNKYMQLPSDVFVFDKVDL